MRALLDTHLLLWTFGSPFKLPAEVKAIILDQESELLFSTASLWEIAIKHSLGRDDFQSEPNVIRRKLFDDDYTELPVFGEHAVAVATLPRVHKDPFDRLLVAQAIVEGVELLTVDAQLADYPGPVRVF